MRVKPGHMIVIPQGAKHNIVNKGKGPLKLFSVYAPPAEPAGVAHRTKADAEKAEQGIVGKAVASVKKALGRAED
jgi:oxalate decarboxylase/phosphoglucose isomerase-like protein (cupin superfamily)